LELASLRALSEAIFFDLFDKRFKSYECGTSCAAAPEPASRGDGVGLNFRS